MAFDQNAVNDFMYNLLNVAGITGTVGTRIFHKRIGPGEEPTYPMVTYQVWSRFRPNHVLSRGVSTYKGSYRIVGWVQDDQRAANTLQKAIETAVIQSSYAAIGSQSVVNLMIDEYIDDTDDQRGDGRVYHQAGAVIELEVTS